MTRQSFIILPLLVFASACSEPPSERVAKPDDTQGMHKSQVKAGPEKVLPSLERSSQNAPNGIGQPMMTGQGRGKVLNVEQAGGYTYVEVERAGRSIWLAGNHSKVDIGDRVRWNDGAVMRNFYSKALQREFPVLMFVSSILPDIDGTELSTGQVLSVAHSAGYTYLEVQAEEQRIWLAAPEKMIKAGDSVQWSGGSTMRDFHSNSLHRDFDTILFVSSVDVI